jgi:hypothetical protein
MQALTCRITMMFLRISLPSILMYADGNESFLSRYVSTLILLAEHQIKIVREISSEEVFSVLNNLLPDSP